MGNFSELCELYGADSALVGGAMRSAALQTLIRMGALAEATAKADSPEVDAALELAADAAFKAGVQGAEIGRLTQLVRTIIEQDESIRAKIRTLELGSVQVSLSMTSPRSGLTLQVTLSEALTDATQYAIDLQTFKLADMAKAAMAKWMKANNVGPAQAPQSANDPKEEKPAPGADLWTPIAGLRLNINQGKRQWRVLCGEWQQHGVPIYDELLNVAVPNHASLEPRDYPVSGKAIIALKADGKPKKAVDLKLDKPL